MNRIISASAILLTLLFLNSCGESAQGRLATNNPLPEAPKDTALMAYGLDMNSFQVKKGQVKPNEFLSDILLRHNVPYQDIDALARNSRDTFDVRKIRAGQEFVILNSKDSLGIPEYFIYESGQEDYVVFCLKDSLYAYCGRKPIEYRQQEASGVITSSLYSSLTNQGYSTDLAMRMADLYAWTVDFYRLQKNDSYKLIYEEKLVDGESIGPGRILASIFSHNGEEFSAYYFKKDTLEGYYDATGASLRKAFLKAPLKFSRISSRYSKRRFHPVLKRYKSHLGTDYAAPHGTPILAVGDGRVSKASYTAGNGNYVKIKHNGTYETQYLHMSKRAVKEGDYVRQGEVIGYVGSTGLATGPHVCFRFWKNGEQVDPLKEKLPASEPMPKAALPDFMEKVNIWNLELNKINLPLPNDNLDAEEEVL